MLAQSFMSAAGRVVTSQASPFIPGARVAILVQNGWRAPASFKRGLVAKVLKSGNFTLEGSPQQWRPYPPSSSGWEKWWHANATGASGASLRIWDETTDADITNKNLTAIRHRRFEAAKSVIDREPFSELITDDVVEKMEAVASAIKPKKEIAA